MIAAHASKIYIARPHIPTFHLHDVRTVCLMSYTVTRWRESTDGIREEIITIMLAGVRLHVEYDRLGCLEQIGHLCRLIRAPNLATRCRGYEIWYPARGIISSNEPLLSYDVCILSMEGYFAS